MLGCRWTLDRSIDVSLCAVHRAATRTARTVACGAVASRLERTDVPYTLARGAGSAHVEAGEACSEVACMRAFLLCACFWSWTLQKARALSRCKTCRWAKRTKLAEISAFPPIWRLGRGWWVRGGVAMRSPWGRHGVAMGSPWGHRGLAMGSPWGRDGVLASWCRRPVMPIVTCDTAVLRLIRRALDGYQVGIRWVSGMYQVVIRYVSGMYQVGIGS